MRKQKVARRPAPYGFELVPLILREDGEAAEFGHGRQQVKANISAGRVRRKSPSARRSPGYPARVREPLLLGVMGQMSLQGVG